MAFAKATRFSGRGSWQSPGPGAYYPQAALGLPRVLAYSFGRPRATTVKPGVHKEKAKKHKANLPEVEIAKLSLERELGNGGLASVHCGTLEGRPVAAKLFRAQPHLLSNRDDDIKALRTEAVLLAKISHPNIVQTLCLLSVNGSIVGFAMEVLGPNLQKASSKGKLCHRDLVEAFQDTCNAVFHIHKLLIAHTDVKAANLCFKDALGGTVTYRS